MGTRAVGSDRRAAVSATLRAMTVATVRHVVQWIHVADRERQNSIRAERPGYITPTPLDSPAKKFSTRIFIECPQAIGIFKCDVLD